MLTTEQKEILKAAAIIIRDELITAGSVVIPRFGKFSVSELKCKDFDGAPITTKVARFKAFDGLKTAVKGAINGAALEPKAPSVRKASAPPVEKPKPAPVEKPAPPQEAPPVKPPRRFSLF